jgi:hypothetical protein
MKSISEIINTALTETKNSIIANHIQAGQVTSGKTSGMFSVENVSMAGGQLYGWKYYQTYETGRKPGGMPPFKSIYDWAMSKTNISPDNEGAIFAIMNKIAKEGSSLYRKGGRKDIFTPPIQKLFDALPGELGRLLVDQFIEWVGTDQRKTF